MQTRPVRPNPGQRLALAEMGIDVWVSALPATGAAVVPAGTGWQALQTEVSVCRDCALAETRTQTVFGVGDPGADWMLIGEAPGAEEDRRGEPFVGRAGQLLNEMLNAVGLAREKVFIANILKCRPPANRDPKPAEIAACAGHLRRQIEFVQPRLILAVGRIAAQSLLQTTTPVGRLRGRVHDYGAAGLLALLTACQAPQETPPPDARRVRANACRDWASVLCRMPSSWRSCFAPGVRAATSKP